MTKMAFDGMGGPRGGMGNMGGPRGGMGRMPAPPVLPKTGIGETGGASPAQMPINMAALSANPLGGTAGPIASAGSGTMSPDLASRAAAAGMGFPDPNVLQRMKKGGKVKSASARADGIAIRGKTRA